MDYGFIYCIGNPCMPGIYKVGMTDRSPRCRVEELSRGTGVPRPFELLFYGDVLGARQAEVKIHEAFDAMRVNDTREFFCCSIELIRQRVASVCETVAHTKEGRAEIYRQKLVRRIADATSHEKRARLLTKLAEIEGQPLWRGFLGIDVDPDAFPRMSQTLSMLIGMLSKDVFQYLPSKSEILAFPTVSIKE